MKGLLHDKFIKGLCFLLLFSMQSWAQSFNVSPGVVRGFAENIISVSIEGWDCGQIQVRTDNGKMKKVGACRYMLIPQRLGIANITVSKVQNGAVIDLGVKALTVDGTSQAARVEPAGNYGTSRPGKEKVPQGPRFEASFAGKVSGELRRRVSFKNRKIILLSDDSKALTAASIVSFRLVLISGDVLQYEKFLESDELDTESLQTILRQKDNVKILFTGIRVRYQGKLILLKDIEFELKS
ncbi:MAG: hypothetical protein BGO31_08750 [Bacteroidetes bacterium 43-16]|nr:MAG: hypothetical protein BGO31_08750 [Bacteroidetes bacterium 43-16]